MVQVIKFNFGEKDDGLIIMSLFTKMSLVIAQICKELTSCSAWSGNCHTIIQGEEKLSSDHFVLQSECGKVGHAVA